MTIVKPNIDSNFEKLEELKFRNEQLFAEDFKDNRPLAQCMPVHIEFETTSRCNLRCFTCTKKYDGEKGFDAEREIFDRIVDELLPTARAICLSGFGEPMMAKHFAYYWEEVVKAGCIAGFTTNGTYLNEDWIEKFVHYPTHFRVSIDAVSNEVMAFLRPHLKRDRLFELMHYWGKQIEANPSSRSDLIIHFVPSSLNIHELPSLVDLAGEWGIKSLEVLHYDLAGLPDEARDAHLRNHKELANEHFNAARERAEKCGVRLVLPITYEQSYVESTDEKDPYSEYWAPLKKNPKDSKYPLQCSTPWYRTYIKANGEVVPCCAYPWPMGDLRQNTFGEIWNDRPYRKLRKTINSRFPHLGCKECNLIFGIAGGRAKEIMAGEKGLDRIHTKLQKLRRQRILRGVDLAKTEKKKKK